MMYCHLLGSGGLLAGTVLLVPISRRLAPRKARAEVGHVLSKTNLDYALKPGMYAIVLAALALRYGWVVLEALSFDIRNILQPYGFEAAEGFAESSLLTVVTYFGLYSSLLFGMIWHRHVTPLPRNLFIGVFLMVGLLGVFWMLRGSRNVVMLIGLPTAAVFLFRKPVKLVIAGTTLVLVISSLYVVGVVRNLGVSNVSVGDVVEIVQSLDPLQGELGTSYSVLGRALAMGQDKDRTYGRGYVIAPLINLVPRAMWPDRPDNPAIEFSKTYFNTDNLSEGLGYSPVLEAIINFGPLGIVPVFATIAICVIFFFSSNRVRSVRGLMLMAFAMPIVVNWNRIDLSTTLKMYSGFVFMAIVLPWIFLRRRPEVRRR